MPTMVHMAGATSRKNGKKGGRPKSNHTLTSEVKRELIAEWIAPHMKPMVMAQVKKAKQGDTKAFQVLCDRAYGRPITPDEKNQLLNLLRYNPREIRAQYS